MNIELIRTKRTRWALDGELRIAGQKVCDTSENLVHHLHGGTHTVKIERCQHYRRKMPIIMVDEASGVAESHGFDHLGTFESKCHHCKKKRIGSQHANLPCYCPQIKLGNGVANRTDGSIIVGERWISGVMLRTAYYYDRLIDRLDKAAQRDEEITLEIKNEK